MADVKRSDVGSGDPAMSRTQSAAPAAAEQPPAPQSSMHQSSMHQSSTHQSSAQWAVRWHGAVFSILLLFAVPAVHLVWHVGLGRDEPLIRTRAQLGRPKPTATWNGVLDGSWMKQQELYLREVSPIGWWLRSWWNELRYRISVPQSDQVQVGRDEWFFIRTSIHPDVAMLEAATPKRRAFIRAVRERVRGAGAELLMMIVPDKVRVYPDFAFEDGMLPPAKAPVYRALLADFAAENVPTVDLEAAMAAARAAKPNEELYFRRDTHWRPAGALVAGQAVAAVVEERFGSLLPPRQRLELGNMESMRLIGDLTALFGIGTVELPGPLGNLTTQPMSFLSSHLAETREYWSLVVRDGDQARPMHGTEPADIVVIGTSFALENGFKATSLALGRPVRAFVAPGPTGLQPVRMAMAEFDRGLRAKVVIWEMVERAFFAPEWSDPKF